MQLIPLGQRYKKYILPYGKAKKFLYSTNSKIALEKIPA
jgi:hypothetical protein